MVTMTIGGLRSATHDRHESAGASVKSVLAQASSFWHFWRAERALAALDDEALHDIGVSRSEIRHAVWTGERS